ncbi:hypothetical protein [Metabacillus sp. Hm71]|uniref:hypothetical protein n=1 Tax=Metabacillus sp. Hm71 TaxID=3450743 RepID=UPI003F4415E8
MYQKVYTSGVIANDSTQTTEGNIAEDLYVSLTNFGNHSAFVKVEVFNWGDPDNSASPPGTSTSPVAVTVLPAEEFEIPSGKTQHFYANIALVESYEVRVTILNSNYNRKVVFNATAVNNQELDSIEALVLFKDFVLLEENNKCKCCKCN